MHIALIADTFPPLRTSGAVQLRDLSLEFVRQGHQLTVILPSAEISQCWMLEDLDGVQVLRLRSPKTKEINYIRRTVNEFVMPFFMLRHLYKSPLALHKWDGVVWYSPSIFHGPFVKALKRSCGCRSYLIVRDIFPEWALDMGLMGRGIPYFILKAVAKFQYSVADVIGVQTPGNLRYFEKWVEKSDRRLEVLQNWLSDTPVGKCSIDVSRTNLAGRKIVIYAGNMGPAQGVEILLDLANRMRVNPDIGFLFVGRGSEFQKLSEDAKERNLNNVLFLGEIDPDEIPGLLLQCHIGLVSLDVKHKSHNIPGKFLTYLHSGLPVLAAINRGNDLANLIRSEDVGRVIEDGEPASLEAMLNDMLDCLSRDSAMSGRCRALFDKLFSPEITVHQIVTGLMTDKK